MIATARWILTAVLLWIACHNSHWSIGLSLCLITVAIEMMIFTLRDILRKIEKEKVLGAIERKLRV